MVQSAFESALATCSTIVQTLSVKSAHSFTARLSLRQRAQSVQQIDRQQSLHTGSRTRRGRSVASTWAIHQVIQRQAMLGHESPNVHDRLRPLRVHVPLRLSEERARTTNQFLEAVIA
jgi:hypothetical protein